MPSPSPGSSVDLALAALQSLGAVAFVVAAGWVYALYGNFPLSMQRDLARMVVQLLAPCLLLVSIAQTVNFESFYQWWPIPALFVVFTTISYILAVMAAKLLNIPVSRARFIASAAMMSNTNSLPVALMHSLARDPGSRAVLQPKDGNPGDVARRGIAFVLFFSLFSNIVRWTLCYRLLAPVGKEDVPEPTQVYNQNLQINGPVHVAGNHSASPTNEGFTSFEPPLSPPLSASHERELFPGDAVLADIPESDPQTYARRLRRRSMIFQRSPSEETDPTLAHHDPLSPLSSPSSPRLLSESTPLLLPGPVPGPSHYSSGPQSPDSQHSQMYSQGDVEEHVTITSWWRNSLTSFQELMNAPLYAALLALFIGLIPPLKAVFFAKEPGARAPMQGLITEPLYSLGEASVPIIILTLGGQLASMKQADDVDRKAEALDVALVILIRMILTPAVMIFIILGAKDHVALLRDPTFAMAMLLLVACPTALNLMNISQAQRNHETVTARLLFWSYLLSIPILTAWLVTDLIIIKDNW
ncbi:membrane transport protein-domain-containing protein [Phlyctochytrium arcticum]|nr:membrane transport protein-domain-containing protein [Phlyctochytrium arcticum]